MLSFLIIMACVVILYIAWIRPILRSQPSLKEFWDAEDTCFAALSAKFSGIKEKLLWAVSAGAGIIITIHDAMAPLVASFDLTPITSTISPLAMLWISLGFMSLMRLFRCLADRRHAQEVKAIESAAAGSEAV